MISFAFGTLLLSALAVCSADSDFDNEVQPIVLPLPFEVPETNIVLNPRGQRELQAGVTSDYMAIWFFVREGSCAFSDEPTVTLECTNGGNLTVSAVSLFVGCEKTDDTSALCTTDTIINTGHGVDFSCSADDYAGTVASATVLEQTDDCLSGTVTPGDWGRGIILRLVCGDGIALNGTCSPEDTTFPDFTCTAGFGCDGNCTEGNLTLPEMSSSITDSSCGDATTAPAAAPTAPEPTASQPSGSQPSASPPTGGSGPEPAPGTGSAGSVVSILSALFVAAAAMVVVV